MAYVLLKIPKSSTRNFGKIIQSNFWVSVFNKNGSHLYEKDWDVSLFLCDCKETRVKLALFYGTQRSGLFHRLHYFLCTDCMKNKKSQPSSTAVSIFWSRSSWRAELVRLLMQVDEADLGFLVKSF